MTTHITYAVRYRRHDDRHTVGGPASFYTNNEAKAYRVAEDLRNDRSIEPDSVEVVEIDGHFSEV
jgi:hypothetical protein